MANFDSVSEDPQAIVDTAIDAFGRLDIVVNNAGINKSQPFSDSPMAAIRQHMEVHFFGPAGVTAAACPTSSRAARRVVNTASPTLFGFAKQMPYVSAKGAIFAFTRTLAMEAAAVGITVNGIAPTAATRMSDEMDAPEEFKQWMREHRPASLVSPLVAYLAHAECRVTGETLLVDGGIVQRMTLGKNHGFIDPHLTPESIRANLDTILDPSTNAPAGLVGSAD